MVVVIMVVVMVVVIAVAITVVVMVPMVIMFKSAMLPVPIPRKILCAVMMRWNPARANVGWPRPVTLMPFIVSPYRIPVALDPNEIRTRGGRKNANHAGRRRRPDIDSN